MKKSYSSLKIIKIAFDIAFYALILLLAFFMIFKRDELVNHLGLEFSIVQTDSMKGALNRYDFLILKTVDPKQVEIDDIVVFLTTAESTKLFTELWI